jgi:hypothetical protein
VANVEGTNVGKDNNEYVIARVRNFEAWARGGGSPILHLVEFKWSRRVSPLAPSKLCHYLEGRHICG